MSYEIIRKIKVDKANNLIKVECASNNVSPRYWSESEFAPNKADMLIEKYEELINNVGIISFDIITANYLEELKQGRKENLMSEVRDILAKDISDEARKMAEDLLEKLKRVYTFEEKIRFIFEDAHDGNIRISSTCGKFYKIVKEQEEYLRILRREIGKRDIPDLDWMYHTNFALERRLFFANQCTNVYLGRPIEDINSAVEDMVSKMEKVYLEKKAEYEKTDQTPIRCAWNSNIWKGKVVLVDFIDHVYIADVNDYTPGLLRNTSNAISLGKDVYSLASVLAGNLSSSTKKEVLDRYTLLIERAARDAAFDIYEKLINQIRDRLPEMEKLPWLDFCLN